LLVYSNCESIDATYVLQAGTTGGEYKTGEPLDVESTACLADSDPAKLQADVTKFCQDALTDAAYMPFADPYILNCYWLG